MGANDQSNPKADNSMSITLMLDKGGRKIMYAEAGKDFVDLLFSFLVLPAGAIAKHALDSKHTKSEEQEKTSCIINLYNSVVNLSGSLMKADKAVLLDQKVVSANYTNDILRIQSPSPRPPPGPPPRFYVCGNASSGSTIHSLSNQCGTVTCPCGYSVSREVKLVDRLPAIAANDPVPTGFVKKRASFVITDDLTVIAVNSSATIIQLWNKLEVHEPMELKEREVTVGPNEVVSLLKAALVSSTALNDVFKAEQPKRSTPVDPDTSRLAVQELLLKLLIEDGQRFRGGKLIG